MLARRGTSSMRVTFLRMGVRDSDFLEVHKRGSLFRSPHTRLFNFVHQLRLRFTPLLTGVARLSVAK